MSPATTSPMIGVLRLCVMATVLLATERTARALEQDVAHSGSITGRVLDADSEPVAGAMVLVCDSASGIPVLRSDSRPFTDHWPRGGRHTDWAFAITDGSGGFRVEGLTNGSFRLIAQSWDDVKQPLRSPIAQAAAAVHVRGVAENITVPSEGANDVALRPLGEGTLHITATSTKHAPFLLLSTSAPGADPALANAAIAGGFLRHMVGGLLMSGKTATVRGLPDGKVYGFLAVMTDELGFGAGAANIEGDSTVRVSVPIYATWAQPRPAPPENLASLMKELRELRKSPDGGRFVAEQLPDLHPERFRTTFHWFAQLAPFFKRPIELPSGGETTLGDVMAAMQHLQIESAVERGDERSVRDVYADIQFLGLDPSRRPAKPKADRSVSYEAAFLDLHDVLGSQYPYFELKEIDWPGVRKEFLPHVQTVKTDVEFGLLCIELVARLEDSHAHLLPGAAPVPEPEFPRWDPGLACLIDDRGKPVVYFVDAGGPADKAGIRPGTTVVSVNGEPAEDALRSFEQSIAKYVGFSSGRYLRYSAARGFIRQMKQDAPVDLELRDAQDRIQNVKLAATKDIRYLPRLPVPIPGIDDRANVSWKRLDSGIGYIHVRRIRNDLIESLDRAVSQLQDVKGLIIDVRGNSGGGFDFQRSHLNFALDREEDEPNRPRFRGPMALLIDARCISAGEGWASWFLANQRARSFGETTAGASSRKTVYRLKNGLFEVRFSVKAYRGYLDRPIESRGLEPDVPLMPNRTAIAERRDVVLSAAEAYLLAYE